MYQFRINHNNFPSIKFSLWIFHMVILQVAITSILNILELQKMKPWQWKSHHVSSAFVKKQMDSLVTFLHHSNHSQTHHLALQLCMPRIQLVSLPDAHYRLEKAQMSVCLHSLHLNVWILTTAPSAVTTTITLICPGETA